MGSLIYGSHDQEGTGKIWWKFTPLALFTVLSSALPVPAQLDKTVMSCQPSRKEVVIYKDRPLGANWGRVRWFWRLSKVRPSGRGNLERLCKMRKDDEKCVVCSCADASRLHLHIYHAHTSFQYSWFCEHKKHKMLHIR